MNRFELWDKVARNSQCLLPQHFRLVVALWYKQTPFCSEASPTMHGRGLLKFDCLDDVACDITQ